MREIRRRAVFDEVLEGAEPRDPRVLRHRPARWAPDRVRLVVARANRQPALAAHAAEETPGAHDAYGVMVFSIQGDRIRAITGFPRRPASSLAWGCPSGSTEATCRAAGGRNDGALTAL